MMAHRVGHGQVEIQRGNEVRQQLARDRAAREAAADRAERIVGFYDRYGPASEDSAFMGTLPTGRATRRERDALIAAEDARRADMIGNMAGFYTTRPTTPATPALEQTGGQSAVDPRIAMRRDGLLPVIGSGRSPGDMAIEDLIAANADADDDDDGVVTSRGPSIYDMERGLLERTLGSQLAGFGEQRDLVAQLADMREQGIAGQQQFAEDRAAGREQFLEETDIRRAEQEEAARVERANRKTADLARQQTQLDDALAAVGVDKNLAGQRLQSLGINPGGFADADMSETTAMLYSQNMSAANMINQLDNVAEQAAMFAKSQNDQASAAAMFGIGEDLSFAMQAFDQARLQGQIDDAQALQGIAAAERQARQAFDSALTTLNVDTKRAAQAAAAAAAARARKEAKEQELLAAGVMSQVAIEKLRAGEEITLEERMSIQMADRASAAADASSAFLDMQTDAANREFDQLARLDLAGTQAVLRGDATYDPTTGAYSAIPDVDAADASMIGFIDETGVRREIPITSVAPLAQAIQMGQLGAFAPMVTPGSPEQLAELFADMGE